MALRSIDLMIGDWVHWQNRAIDPDIWLDSPIRELQGDHCHLEYGGGDPFDYDEIEPIPLTPKILDKNFEKKTFYGIYDDYFDLDIREYSDGLYIVTYHSCEFNIPDQTIHLSWVHELQHFMRHCGIEKEIEL